MTATRIRPIVATLFAITLLFASLAQGAPSRRPGLTTLTTAPQTDAGEWAGTWVYKTRNQRVVLWLQLDGSGKPEYRLQYQSLGTPEAFTTDWTGRADYTVTGTDGLFHLAAAERDANTISGTVEWNLQFEKSGRRRTGKFKMHRGGDGRHLVMNFYDQELTVRRRGKEGIDRADTAWTFIKYSKRLVSWEEVF